jgi:uncharacterized protein involved in exopolysaccharide biosynthesis
LEPQGLSDYLEIWTRRKRSVILTSLCGIVVAAAVALLWPPTYRSSATILMEEPAVPRDLVRSTITSYADQRVQVITQRVMATRNLITIMEKHNLFADRRETEPASVLAEELREDINFKLISAEVVDPRSGRPTEANIAFTLSFDYGEPGRAQRVLSELVSLYLAENLRTRQQTVAETAEFMAKEAAKLETLINGLEAKLAAFKRKHAGTLPEDAQVNARRIERFQRELGDATSKISVLEERRIFLKSELAQIDPQLGAFKKGGVRVLTPKEQLRALQTEMIGLNSRYGPQHPDVVRLKREIKALEEEVGSKGGGPMLKEGLKAAEAELAELRKKYGREHPDVVKQRRTVEGLRAALKAEGGKGGAGGTPGETADNPAYIQLRAQLRAVEFELKGKRAEVRAARRNLERLEEAMARAPEVEAAYLSLQRQHTEAATRQLEVKAKLMQAELGKSLEAAAKSERLSLIEPPSLPVEPIRPNRWAIMILGLVLSVGSGVGLAGLFEATDKRVYGARHLALVAGAPPLAVIPEIERSRDIWGKRVKVMIVLAAFAGLVAAAAWAVHNLVMPLDVLWFTVERKLGVVR